MDRNIRRAVGACVLIGLLAGYRPAAAADAKAAEAKAAAVEVGRKVEQLPAWAPAQLDELKALNAFAEAALDKFTDIRTGKPCCEFHHGNVDDVAEGIGTWDRFALLGGSEKVRTGMVRLWQYLYDEMVRQGEFVDGFYAKGYDAEHTGELYQLLHAIMEFDVTNPKLAEANRKIADVIIDRCYNKQTRLLHHAILSTTGGANRKDNPFVDEIMNGLYILNAFRAYMTTGDEKYRASALEYGGKWNELAAGNHGVLPYAADSKTGKMAEPWWGSSSFSYKIYGVITAAREMQGWAPAMVLLDGGNARHLSGVMGTLDAMFTSRKDGLPNTKVDETGWSRDKASWFVPKLIDRVYALTFDPAVGERIRNYYAAVGPAGKAGDKSAATEEQFLRWHMFTYFGQFDEAWAAEQFSNGAKAWVRKKKANIDDLKDLPKSGDEITEKVFTRPIEMGMVDGCYFGDYDDFRAGAPCLASIRYWRTDGVCGLPDGVAALVRNVNKDGVHLFLCNTTAQPATLNLIGGFYGQHRIEAIAEGGKTHPVAARSVLLTLPANSVAELKVSLTRNTYRPTLTPLAGEAKAASAATADIPAPVFFGRREQAITKADVASLSVAVKAFEVDCGRYPTTEEGLGALVRRPANIKEWHGPYIEKVLKNDSWGNPYVYRCPGQHNTKGFDLYSLGPDGKEGGGDDIDNWSEKSPAIK